MDLVLDPTLALGRITVLADHADRGVVRRKGVDQTGRSAGMVVVLELQGVRTGAELIDAAAGTNLDSTQAVSKVGG